MVHPLDTCVPSRSHVYDGDVSVHATNAPPRSRGCVFCGIIRSEWRDVIAKMTSTCDKAAIRRPVRVVDALGRGRRRMRETLCASSADAVGDFGEKDVCTGASRMSHVACRRAWAMWTSCASAAKARWKENAASVFADWYCIIGRLSVCQADREGTPDADCRRGVPSQSLETSQAGMHRRRDEADVLDTVLLLYRTRSVQYTSHACDAASALRQSVLW